MSVDGKLPKGQLQGQGDSSPTNPRGLLLKAGQGLRHHSGGVLVE